MSFAAIVMIFLIFFVLRFFRSWLGVMCFQGTTNLVKGFFGLLQRAVVVIYQSLLGLTSRHAEYRSDKFSYLLGYGVRLSHFLALAEPNNQRKLTLTEAIYRSHPPIPKRIACLEGLLLKQNTTEIMNRRVPET